MCFNYFNYFNYFIYFIYFIHSFSDSVGVSVRGSHHVSGMSINTTPFLTVCASSIACAYSAVHVVTCVLFPIIA
jgi:hypothetical protein